MIPPKINLYKYYFRGAEKPIEIESTTKTQSLVMLEKIISRSRNEDYQITNIVNETVETLIPNVSTKVVKGETYVFTGTAGELWIKKQ